MKINFMAIRYYESCLQVSDKKSYNSLYTTLNKINVSL